MDVFRNKRKALRRETVKMIALDSKSEPKADQTKDKTVDTGHRDIGEAIRPDLIPVSLEEDCNPIQLNKWWEGCGRFMNLCYASEKECAEGWRKRVIRVKLPTGWYESNKHDYDRADSVEKLKDILDAQVARKKTLFG